MAEFVVYPIAIGVWVKVVDNKKVGNIQPLTQDGHYVQVIQTPATAAPTNGDTDEGVAIPLAGGIVAHSTNVDVYVAIINGKAGSVRVDG